MPKIAVCAVSLDRAQGDLKRLMPAGTFSAPRGAMSGQGPWHLDQQSATALIASARNRSTNIVIDYEHQTLMAAENGKPAPASGWVDPKTLEWREDGLYGVIKWTAAAKAMIDAEEYQYLSPVFPYDANGTPLDLLQIALTNTPAIHGLDQRALAAARAALPSDSEHSQPETDEMDLKILLEALGLPDDTTETNALKTVAALKAGNDQLAALRAELGLKDGDDAKPAIAALKATPAGSVPQPVYDELKTQLAALKASGEESERNRLIEDGMADGRIAGKATADWLRTQPIAVLKSHLADATPLAALKGMQSAGKEPDKKAGAAGLSDNDLAVCKQMGISPEEYAKANA
ncbi:phage protease [Thalassospira marina]|uniref:phage protease n=1 Tax=Thalassospira marina TaxID=2048283 RepID=UPI001C06D426|nr:phage protease [Thalassospira marina]